MFRVFPFLLTVLAAFATTSVHAAEMPTPEALTAQMGPPQTVRVYEPHLSTGDRHVEVDYLGYPAEEVLDRVLGPEWRTQAEAIEFRALDGYVSRIDVGRFTPGRAYLVFARQDGAAFTVDNLGQNEKDVPLGPYYLIWNNISDPALLAEGASGWPYQVVEISAFTGSDTALRPPGLAGDHDEAIGLVKTNCLSCHKVNGYGGEKFPGNLAELAKGRPHAEFLAWVLAPSSIRPGTTMPPLAPLRPQAERERLARLIHAYLSAVPVIGE